MQSESYFYKDDLSKAIKTLKKYDKLDYWKNDKSYYLLEKTLFFGFFVIRKLIENKKITDEEITRDYKCKYYKILSEKIIHRMNKWDIDKNFELGKQNIETMKISEICNQFIHSYVFMLVLSSRGRMRNIFVSSDFQRNKKVYLFNIKDVVRIFRNIALDIVVTGKAEWDEEKKDYRVKNSKTKDASSKIVMTKEK